MPKGGQRDVSKEQRWRQVFADWQKTGLSGAEYCRQNDIIYTQFQDWRKQVRKLDAESENGSPYRRRMATRAQGIAAKLERQRESERSVDFAQVHVVEREDRRNEVPKTEDIAILELVFPSGTKLRLSAGCPLDLLSSVVAILENR